MAVGYAYSILRDFHLAEDAAQEAFTEAYPNLHKVYGPEAFPSWFRKILFKHCDRTLRGKRLNATRLEAAGSVAATDGDPASIAEARELEAELRKAVNSLPPTARSAITLFYISGCIPPGQSAEFVCAMEDVLEPGLHQTDLPTAVRWEFRGSWCAWMRRANSKSRRRRRAASRQRPAYRRHTQTTGAYERNLEN